MITYGSTTLANIRDGEDGTSVTITSTSIKYQKGTSGTTKPTGTWQTSIPSIGENEYLWTQTIVNYSDGSKTEAYSVSRNAKNGTSPTVSSTVVEYQQSTGGTTPPTGTWSSIAPTAIAGQYMWTKTTITYSDSKTAISYSVSKNGSDGALFPNLTPFFSHDITDIYDVENNPNGYWMDNGTSYGWTKNSKFTFTQLEDGWLHVHIDNSSGTSTIRNDCCVPKYNPSIKRATKYTFLAEFRNNQSTGAASGSDFYLVQQSGSVQFWG